MTTYERFKATALVVLCACLVSVSVASYKVAETLSATSREVSSTLVTAQATLDALNSIVPPAISTLKTVQTQANAVGKQATASLKAVTPVLHSVNNTLEAVNRLCDTWSKPRDVGGNEAERHTLPCGTLADINRTLATVRGTFGQVEIAARHETRNLDEFDAQEKQLYADFHQTTTSLNDLLASPEVARFLKSSADTSVQFAIMSTEGAAIATNVRKESDKLTAPTPWWHKIGNYTTTGVNVACLVTHSCPF